MKSVIDLQELKISENQYELVDGLKFSESISTHSLIDNQTEKTKVIPLHGTRCQKY